MSSHGLIQFENCNSLEHYNIGVLGQSTVDFPIDSHVNVLSDYKEIEPEKKIKCLRSHCNQVTDMLIKFRQNYIGLALQKCKLVRCPSILTKFSTFFCIYTVTLNIMAKNHYANYTPWVTPGSLTVL